MQLRQWAQRLVSRPAPMAPHEWVVDGALIELYDDKGDILQHWRLSIPLSLSTTVRVSAAEVTSFKRFLRDRLSALQQELTLSAGAEEALLLLGGDEYRGWRTGERRALPLNPFTLEAFWNCFTTPDFTGVEHNVRILLAFAIFEKRCELPAHV